MAMSIGKSDKLFDFLTESDESNDNDVEESDRLGQENLDKLKSLRAKVDWQIEAQRREFLAELYPLVQNWKGQLPDLRDIFRPEEIDWLLTEEVTCLDVCLGCDIHALPIVDFVIGSGYVDRLEPPLPLHRVTPLHALARRQMFSWDTAVRRLFQIYNQFDVNYADDRGLTLFHIACMTGCDDAVRKFLAAGQDADCVFPHTGDSPLHLALYHCRIEVVSTLLRHGAHPNLSNNMELTPLLVICTRKRDSDLLALLFEHTHERYLPLPINVRDRWGSTPLNMALLHNHKKVVKALLRNGADPNMANDNGMTPLHTIYDKRSDIIGLAETYFRICDERHHRVEIDVQDSIGQTPLHLAVNYSNRKAVESLLRRGADPNRTSVARQTPLHVACLRGDYSDMVELIIDVGMEVENPVLINARDKQGDTALHLAVELGYIQSAEALLRRGADPTLTNNAGSTPLHIICSNYHDITELFFEVCNEIHQEVQLDARDRMGDAPLHLALNLDEPESAECLLRRGADWNLVNDFGDMALHIICDKTHDDAHDHLADLIFELALKRDRPVLINLQGNLGYAPLHFALRSGNKRLTALLLRKGADANLPTVHGSTPLHIICKRDNDDDLVKLFFDVNEEIEQRVQVDYRDSKGRTPLQWAVACLLPKVVDVLLDHGADLSGFVFPARSLFEHKLKPGFGESWHKSKLKLVAGALVVVERLERRGYKLNPAEALTIMSLFAKYGIFETTTMTSSSSSSSAKDPKKSWYDDDAELVKKAKELRVKEGLSLDDLIQAPLETVAKLLGRADYLQLARSYGLCELPTGYIEALDRHLCEKISRKFFYSRALESFMELTHNRLPLICCDMVIDNLSNEDLYNICSATAGQNTV